MKKVKLILSLILVLCLALTSCGGNDKQDGGDQGEASGREDLVMALAGDITSFDPQTTTTAIDEMIHRQIYDPLMYMLSDRSLVPALAESCEVNSDSSEYIFKIRSGVKFHNGEELTADDVTFSLRRYMESPFFFTFVSGIASVETVDANTVKVSMTTPDASFMQYLPYFSIVNEKAITEAGDAYDDAPVGTGPYKVVSYARANEIKLTRNDDYYREPASIKDVTFRIIPDSNTRTISLQAGDLDYGYFDTASYENIKSDENLDIVKGEQSSVFLTILNHDVAPFDNKKVRQAISYAVDRDFIIDAVCNGFATPATNILPPANFGYSEDIEMDYTYDIEKAKKLIEESGITTPMDIGKIVTVDAYKTRSEIMQQNLAAIGLNAELEVMELTKYGEVIASGDYAIATRDMGSTGDASIYALLLHSSSIGGLNWARYSNPKVDELFDKAKSESDPEKRLAMYTEVFKIVGDDAVYITEAFPQDMTAKDSNLQIAEGARPGFYVYDMSWGN